MEPKFSLAVAEEIQSKYSSGLSRAQLMEEYDASYSTIGNVLAGKSTYKGLPDVRQRNKRIKEVEVIKEVIVEKEVEVLVEKEVIVESAPKGYVLITEAEYLRLLEAEEGYGRVMGMWSGTLDSWRGSNRV